MLSLSRLKCCVPALFLILVSCAPRSGAVPEDSPESYPSPETEDRVLKADYSVEITGEVEIHFSGIIDLRVLTLTGTDPAYAEVYLLSVGPNDRTALNNGAYFRVAFDLMRFRGDGQYRIRAGSPRAIFDAAVPNPGEPPEQPDQSNVLIQFWPSEDIRSLRTFDVTLDPCPLEVSRGGLTGTLRCPRVADESEHVLNGVVMSWNVVS